MAHLLIKRDPSPGHRLFGGQYNKPCQLALQYRGRRWKRKPAVKGRGVTGEGEDE